MLVNMNKLQVSFDECSNVFVCSCVCVLVFVDVCVWSSELLTHAFIISVKIFSLGNILCKIGIVARILSMS